MILMMCCRGRQSYLTIREDQEVFLHPSTTLASKADWVIYNEYVLTTKNYIRTVTRIEGSWLLEIAPLYFNEEHFCRSLAGQVLHSKSNKA